MPPTLSKGGKIYFLAESPGADEDSRSGRPLTGPSGQLLRECIPDGMEDECSFDNQINCRPTKNRDPEWTEIECCRPRRNKYIQEAKPLLIVGLGRIPLHAILGSHDLQGMRGRLFAVKFGEHVCWFLPTYHPSFVLRVAKNKRKPLNSMMGHCFRMDLKRAFEYVEWLGPPQVLTERELKSDIQCFDGSLSTHEADVFELLEKAGKAKEKAIDIETKGLRPYKPDAAIMSAAFSFGSINFSFALDHPKAGWSKAQKSRIKEAVGKILTDGHTKIAHNCFSGNTEIITTKGLRRLDSLVGKYVGVWTKNGWAVGYGRNFGTQSLKELELVPYNRSTSKIKHTILTTPGHNWVVERRSWIGKKERLPGEKSYRWKRLGNFVKTADLKLKDKIVAASPNVRKANTYSDAFIHGMLFADGSLIKNGASSEHYPHNIRLCGWKAKYADRFEKVTYPPSTNGDPVCNWYVSKINCKELPPEGSSLDYIQDFIEGWQLLDGGKGPGYKARIVYTTKETAAIWLSRHAPLVGWYVTGFVPKQGVNFSGNPVTTWWVTISKDENMAWTVRKVTTVKKKEKVYCVTVPGGGCFTLANGIYTGNCPFEVEWFVHFYGREIVRHHEWHCTQMQCHFLDERRGKAKSTDEQDRRAAYQALKFLTKEYFGIDHKSVFKLDKKDMSKSDLGETLLYNAVDTKVTLMLHHWQTKLLKHFGLYEAYLEARPRQTSAAMMQHFGVHVDQKEVKAAQNKLKPEIKKLEADIADLKVVRAYVKDHGEFNPGSQDHVVEIFKDYLKRPEVEIKQERYEAHDFNKSSQSKKRYDDGNGTRYSVDKNVLDQIDHPLAGLIVNWRNRTKLKSTYVDDFELGKGESIYPDGYLHPNFNMTFAETGRTSSDGPNAQNFPKRNDEWVRKQITAPDGHILVAFDYGQLEACGAAMCSKDKVLVKALWEDYDIHMEWAQKTAYLYPEIIGGKKYLTDKGTMKKFRSKIKNKLVFPAIFGAQNSSIAGYLDMPEDIIENLMDEFWGTFTGLHDWQEKLMKRYWEVGYTESLTGRRRHYPMTKNQAINDPVQSVSCDIVCRGMDTLSELAVEEQAWHLHPIMNIHDDLTFCMPDDDKLLEQAIKDVYSVMLTPGYDFINVPLSVTCSIGKHWFGMQEIGKFWSHRDVK